MHRNLHTKSCGDTVQNYIVTKDENNKDIPSHTETCCLRIVASFTSTDCFIALGSAYAWPYEWTPIGNVLKQTHERDKLGYNSYIILLHFLALMIQADLIYTQQ